MNIDLMQFCSKERRELANPFSQGEWSYATTGHIIVRVPRRANVADWPDAPRNVADLFAKRWRKPQISFPELSGFERCIRCTECALYGIDPACPDCRGDSGFAYPHIKLDGFTFDGAYIALMRDLPNVRYRLGRKEGAPMSFAFEGGTGLLMPLGYPRDIAECIEFVNGSRVALHLCSPVRLEDDKPDFATTYEQLVAHYGRAKADEILHFIRNTLRVEC